MGETATGKREMLMLLEIGERSRYGYMRFKTEISSPLLYGREAPVTGAAVRY